MGRKKKEAPVVETGPDPYQVGLYGETISLYQADFAAKLNVDKAELSYKAEQKKHDAVFGPFRRLSKLWAALDAYEAAQRLPYQIHQKVYDGALQSFREDRPENLQEILAHPQEFLRSSSDSPEWLLANTIITLLEENPDPVIPALALKKAGAEEKPNILNNALLTVIEGHNVADPAKTAALLLRAGARAKGMHLAKAIDNDAPEPVLDLLVKNGTSYHDALRVMRQNPDDYSGGASDRLELALTKEANTHLRETMRALTGEEPVDRLSGSKSGEAEVYKGRPKEIRTKPISL